MALFLNTQKISHWLNEIISGAEKELILIVPYIKTSNNIFESLQDADDRGVEIILIYRENKLNEKEKIKLFSLKNITILHHPNIHCKSLMSGKN
jgi:sugar-specific transcriptional regulator TrmB